MRGEAVYKRFRQSPKYCLTVTPRYSVMIFSVDLNRGLYEVWVERLQLEPNGTVSNWFGAYPNQIINVVKEQQLLSKHDRIAFQLPMYWSVLPRLKNGKTFVPQ